MQYLQLKFIQIYTFFFVKQTIVTLFISSVFYLMTFF